MITTIKPNKGSQELFLRSSADILVFGGARGGGKSYALLLEVIRHIDNPKFNAVIFRRTYPQINAEGGLWDRSNELFPLVGGKANKSQVKWVFPSGATCSFRHLKHEQDKLNWQGAEICYLGLDEATHFTWSMFTFLMSSNRSTCGIKPFIRLTCNPDPNSWVKDLIKPWLNSDGYPNPDRAGKLEYFILENNSIKFVENNYQDEGQQALSVTFINSDIYDNPKLIEKDPKYLQMLKTLPLVERERFLGKKGFGGNWNIKEEAGTIFKKDWFTIKNYPVEPQDTLIRFWDLGATTLKNAISGDFTVGLLLQHHVREDIYVIRDVIKRKHPPAYTNQLIMETARLDGERVLIRWQQEPGASGVRDSVNLQGMLRGYNAVGIIDNRDKVSRALPISYMAEQRKIHLAIAPWNNDLLNELEGFPDQCQHDDQVDSLSGAFNELSRPKTRESRFKH